MLSYQFHFGYQVECIVSNGCICHLKNTINLVEMSIYYGAETGKLYTSVVYFEED